ncbi:MAG: hypothetical protein ACRDOI_16715, partial [Trebonia sp.]
MAVTRSARCFRRFWSLQWYERPGPGRAGEHGGAVKGPGFVPAPVIAPRRHRPKPMLRGSLDALRTPAEASLVATRTAAGAVP